MTEHQSIPPAEGDRSTILIVDDMPQNLTLLGEILQPYYRVRAANGGERALRAAQSAPRPDLILLDVMMPDMDGHAVLARLRETASTRDIPVIFVTALNETSDEERGLALGAVDYITKPVNPPIVLARVRTHLELKLARDRLRGENDWLEQEVARRMRENLLVQDLGIRAMACIAEARDNDTGNHILRTQAYVRVLAGGLASHERFRDALAGPRLEKIVKASPLHDIGKVGIPDSILHKPGRLTPEEFRVMQAHPLIGADAIGKAMEQSISASDLATRHAAGAVDFLDVAREISRSHHERWDGTGYPDGLLGDAIPVSARLMALADVFDALLCRRIYKPALPLDQTTRMIVDAKGTHFDPSVVDVFLDCIERFGEIAARYADPLTVDPRIGA